MPTYVVHAAIPTRYVIDARSPQLAMQKATSRFQHEHQTDLLPELMWEELKGSPNDAEWVVVDWGAQPR
jgi:hypothetical protein